MAAATDRLERLEAEYGDVSAEESVLLGQALHARDHLDIPMAQRETLNEFAHAATNVEMSRGSFLTSGAAYVTNPAAAGDPAELVDAASGLRDEEQQLAEQSATARSVLDDASLPASLEVVETDSPKGPHLKGQPFTVLVGLSNVGDEPAAGVTGEVTTDVAVSPTDVTVGSLGGGETATLEFEVAAETAGQVTLRLRFHSDDAGSASEVLRFEVVDKATMISHAAGSLDDLVTFLQGADLPKGLRNALLKKVRAARGSVDRAESMLSAGKVKQANDQLGTASKQLGALLNQLDADGLAGGNGKGDGASLPSDVRRTVESAAEAAIDQVTLARRAEP